MLPLFFLIIVFLVLKDCLYIFESRKNLILISSLCKLNYSFKIKNKKWVFIKLNNSFICSGSLIDSLYRVLHYLFCQVMKIVISHIKERNLTLIQHNFGTYA